MTPPKFQKLVIYGVGLLGGSLGMALRRRGMAGRITGLGRSMERLERARQLGAIDEGFTSLAPALEGADALILAIPPRQIRERWEELAPLIEPGCFVTDVGSVKAAIVAQAEAALPAHARFVGSHPMAGSEKNSVEYSRSDFYEGSACILTPTANTDPATLELARQFWSALGCYIVQADPASHDQMLAAISHLPHVAAAALLQSICPSALSAEQMALMAGGGLRDATRIAAAEPEIWKQICSENAPALVARLDAYIEQLQAWRTLLEKSTPDGRTMGQWFDQARTLRQTLDTRPAQGES